MLIIIISRDLKYKIIICNQLYTHCSCKLWVIARHFGTHGGHSPPELYKGWQTNKKIFKINSWIIYNLREHFIQKKVVLYEII